MENRLSKLLNTRVDNEQHTSRVRFSNVHPTGFPLVISPRSSGLLLQEWFRENKNMVEEKLLQQGAILFRGFEVNTVQKFQDFIAVLNLSPLEYKQRSSPRYEVAEHVYHSTTYPAEQSINMHSENSYALQWPQKIVFCCLHPAEEQGETPIADCRLILSHIHPLLRKKFMDKQVRYVRNLSKEIGLSWEEAFQTHDKLQVEEECRLNGMEFRWEAEGRLVLSWNNSAIHTHPVTREQVWFNHAFFFNKYALEEEVLSGFHTDDELPFNTFFGDGTEITKEEIEEIKAAYEKSTVLFPWQTGDVLFMDNMLTAHGRRPYKGDRKIIVSMF